MLDIIKKEYKKETKFYRNMILLSIVGFFVLILNLFVTLYNFSLFYLIPVLSILVVAGIFIYYKIKYNGFHQYKKSQRIKTMKKILSYHNCDIDQIKVLLNILSLKNPRKSLSKVSFIGGLGFVLTVISLLIDNNGLMDELKLKTTLVFVFFYSFVYSTLFYITDTFKLFTDKFSVFPEIESVLLDVYMELSFNNKKTKNYGLDFMRKSIFGRELDFTNKDLIVLKCIDKSYDDMLSGGRFYINKINDFNKKDFIHLFKEIIEKHKYKYSIEMLNETMLLFGKDEKIGVNGKNNFATRLGLSQKVVNMTYKYLYCVNEFLGELNIDYSLCDCPLDSIVLKHLKNKTSWTKLVMEDYLKIQDDIRIFLKENHNDDYEVLGNLLLDFIVW